MSDDDIRDDDDDMTMLELEEDDAALILRANGDIESFIPELGDAQTVQRGTPLMMAAVLMYILSDEKRYQALEEEFLDLCQETPPPNMPPNKLLH